MNQRGKHTCCHLGAGTEALSSNAFDCVGKSGAAPAIFIAFTSSSSQRQDERRAWMGAGESDGCKIVTKRVGEWRRIRRILSVIETFNRNGL